MQPKVGDTVLLKATVTSVNVGSLRINFVDCEKPGQLAFEISAKRVHAILPREPQAGDTVWYPGSPWDGGTLLFIHQGEGDSRKWATVAFKGDIPQSIPFDAIRLDR